MSLVANITDSRLSAVRNAIAQSFREDPFDGFWYPDEPGTSLVRITLHTSGYMIERRRDERSPWMPITVADLAEFDREAFNVWLANWPRVA